MFRCGFYEKEITPPLGCDIPGYSGNRSATGVKTRLYAKAIAIEANGKTVIMISVDALSFPRRSYEKAIASIEKHTGITPEYVMMHATHSHTGGPLEGRENIKYWSDTFKEDNEYTDMLGRLVGDCGVLAVQRLEPMTAKFAKTEIHGIAFVRNYIMKDGNIRTNPGYMNPEVVGPVTEIDPEFPVIFFFDESGRPRGMMSNYGLHHDTTGGREYCADYSGILGDEMKKEFGNDFVSVYINGACGNVNHFDITREKHRTYKEIGKVFAETVMELYKTAEDFEIDCVDGIKELVEVDRREITDEQVAEFKRLIEEIPTTQGLKASITEPETDAYKRIIAPRMLNFAGLPGVIPTPVQAIRLGECVLYALPGEVYNDYGKYIKANSPAKINFVAEIANGGIYCYIPSKIMFDKNAYESSPSSAPYEADTGERLSVRAVELGKKIYK